MVSRRKMNIRKSTKSRRIMKSRRRSRHTMAKRSTRTNRRRSTRKLGGKPKLSKALTMARAFGSNTDPTRRPRTGASGDAIAAIKRRAAAEQAAAEQAAAEQAAAERAAAEQAAAERAAAEKAAVAGRVDKIGKYNMIIKDLRDSINLNTVKYIEVIAKLDNNVSYFPDNDEEYEKKRKGMHQELHKLSGQIKFLKNKLDVHEKERDILQDEQDEYLGSIDASVF